MFKISPHSSRRYKQIRRFTLCVFLCIAFLPTPTVFGNDGGELFAAVCLNKDYWQVYLKKDGTEFQQLTYSAVDKSHISWTADKDILLMNTNSNTLLSFNIESGEERPIDIDTRGMTDAVWSADGKKILFSLSIASSIDANDIWLINLDSRKRSRLTNMKHMQHDPAWSHDEKQLVFVSGAGGQNHDLFVLNMESGATKQLTAGQRYHFEPACSINNEIAFSSNRTDDYEIWVCDIEGKHFDQITHSPGMDSEPTWSPDGRKIAFVSSRGGYPAIWVINRDSSNPHQISPVGMKCRGPAWNR